MMKTLTAPVFDPELIARYDTLGPRYTSYPTAPQFTETFGAAELRAAIRASNEEPIPRELSLYVHVPFCFSPCFYCGCNRVITRDIGKADCLPGAPVPRDRAGRRRCSIATARCASCISAAARPISSTCRACASLLACCAGISV